MTLTVPACINSLVFNCLIRDLSRKMCASVPIHIYTISTGLKLRGTSESLEFRANETNQIELVCKPHQLGQTIYWLTARLALPQSLLAKSMVLSVDYDIMHRCFAHPSKDVLQHTSGNTENFPSIKFPSHNPVCPGCTEGKMTSSLLLPSQSQATKPFGKIHIDLKSFPVQSYYGSNYMIVYLDDYMSHSWIQCMKAKSDTAASIRQFVALVKTRYNSSIVEVMIDAGGEFKSMALTTFLKT